MVVRTYSAEAGEVPAESDTKILGIRVLNFVTNYLINRIPSYGLRHWWYRRILGIKLGRSSAVFLGCYVWFYGPGAMRRNGLRVGDRCRINRNCCLDSRGSLTIGNDVSISPDVTILTASHHYNDPSFHLTHGSVVLEDHVWVGTRALILPGVVIGRGAVVGAGAVVTKDVPPLTVVGGNPARQIGMRDLQPGYALNEQPPLFE